MIHFPLNVSSRFAVSVYGHVKLRACVGQDTGPYWFVGAPFRCIGLGWPTPHLEGRGQAGSIAPLQMAGLGQEISGRS